MTTSLLARLKADGEAAALACHPFEFDTGFDTITHVEPVWLASGAPLEPIAKDHGGGTYFLCGEGDGEDRPVLSTPTPRAPPAWSEATSARRCS